jgi:hypothetical protein
MRPISVAMTGKPMRLPITNGVPYSSMPQAKAKKPPASRAGKVSGKRMRATILPGAAPAICPALKSDDGILSI